MTFLRTKGDLPAQWVDLIDEEEVPRVTIYTLLYAKKWGASKAESEPGIYRDDDFFFVVLDIDKIQEEHASAAATLFSQIVCYPKKEVKP